ncbi:MULTISPECIES: IS66-like element accessory protein TnpA [unclassified Rhizobium]|uniref:IS66-like element accessory protein TnpA n=1 Tax=unclassified Rhizobium TaxID=2613769 RepID=UPI0021683F3D|nr:MULTISPECIES: transposase [unclassified Rhizobium]MCS3742233.1 transposase [Rhizobium sp. BK661]MCS4096242.1 transposase [Rhizobium sp. BK176]
MDEDAPKLQVRLVGRDGRRRYDPASRDQLVAACLEPGVSVSRLALEHGVNANLVRKWVRRAREDRALPVVSAFVPVQIAADMHSSSASGPLTKAEPVGKRSHASKVSAVLPNGVSLTVECSDVDGLAAIIGALSHVQTWR